MIGELALTTHEQAALAGLRFPDTPRRTVVLGSDQNTILTDAITHVAGDASVRTPTYFSGLMSETHGYASRPREGEEPALVAIDRYPSSAAWNKFFESLGYRPGVDILKMVDCDEIDDEGKIPGPHFLGHVAEKEAPRTTQPEYAGHDWHTPDHTMGWPTLQGKLLDDTADMAGRRVETYEGNRTYENRYRIATMVNAVDLASSLNEAGLGISTALADSMPTGRVFRARPGLPPSSPLQSITPLTREVYFNGSERVPVLAVELRAWPLHRQRFRDALEMTARAERLAAAHEGTVPSLARRAVYWAKTHVPV
jgi:hypothetical protein